MTAESDSSRPSLDSKVAQALNLSAEDLAANAEGQLSASQVTYLDAQNRADRRNRFLTALFFGAIGLFFTVTTGDTFNMVLFALVVGSILNLALRDWRLVSADLDARTVTAIDGLLAQPSRRNLRAMFQEPSLVLVGEERFHLDPNKQRAFASGQTYRFYFTPNARLIVGAEPLDDALDALPEETDADAPDDEVVFQDDDFDDSAQDDDLQDDEA